MVDRIFTTFELQTPYQLLEAQGYTYLAALLVLFAAAFFLSNITAIAASIGIKIYFKVKPKRNEKVA